MQAPDPRHRLLWFVSRVLWYIYIWLKAIFYVLPLLLFVLIPKMAIQTWRETAERPYLRREMISRIRVPMVKNGEERDAYFAFAGEFEPLLEQPRWPELLQRLRDCEQSRSLFPSLDRHYLAAMEGALGPLERAIEQGAPAANASLALYRSIHLTHPENHLAAALYARALCLVGWLYRGSGFVQETDPAHLEKFAELHDQAATVLAPFDAIEADSPILAMACYQLVKGLPDGGQQLSRRYDDWARLDPDCLNILDEHGFLLLPRWFGTYDEIEVEARRAAARCDATIGNGAYAVFWLAAVRCEVWLLSRIEIDMFCDGIRQLLNHASSQKLANGIACGVFHLSRAVTDMTGKSLHQDEGPRLRLRALLGEIYRDHICEIQQSEWDVSALVIAESIVEAFDEEIEAGMVIVASEQGMTAVMPEPLTQPAGA